MAFLDRLVEGAIILKVKGKSYRAHQAKPHQSEPPDPARNHAAAALYPAKMVLFFAATGTRTIRFASSAFSSDALSLSRSNNHSLEGKWRRTPLQLQDQPT
jgi:hypothetical protein